MAWAEASPWVRVSFQASMPAAADRSAARPVTTSEGTPSPSRSTSMSCQPNGPRPHAERLHHRLLGGEAHCEPGHRARHTLGVLPLGGREQASTQSRSALQSGTEATEVDHISADADDAPGGDHVSAVTSPGRHPVPCWRTVSRASGGHDRQRSARSFTGSVMSSITGTVHQQVVPEDGLSLGDGVLDGAVAVPVALEHRPQGR